MFNSFFHFPTFSLFIFLLCSCWRRGIKELLLSLRVHLIFGGKVTASLNIQAHTFVFMWANFWVICLCKSNVCSLLWADLCIWVTVFVHSSGSSAFFLVSVTHHFQSDQVVEPSVSLLAPETISVERTSLLITFSSLKGCTTNKPGKHLPQRQTLEWCYHCGYHGSGNSTALRG